MPDQVLEILKNINQNLEGKVTEVDLCERNCRKI